MIDIEIEKSPNEDWLLEINFGKPGSDWRAMFLADPIFSATATDWDGGALSGITAGTPAIDSTGLIVQTRIAGGTAGTTYQIKIKATSTTNGYDGEAFVTCYVRKPS
jgi:hypothetical protein